MTKISTNNEIEERLGRMGIDIRWSGKEGNLGERKEGKKGSGKGALGKERNKKSE